MNLRNLLESTYDLSFTQQLYDYIYSRMYYAQRQLNVSRYYDITPFFPEEYNKFDRKIKLHLRTSFKKEDQKCNAFLNNAKDVVVIELITGQRFENYTVTSLKRIMRHEITHALDFLRMPYYRMSDRNREKYNRRTDKGERTLSYRNDEQEINAAINLLIPYKKEFPKSWESITSYEKLQEVMSRAGFNKPSKEILNDKGFKRKILQRLARENLLPPNLKL